MKIRIAVAMSRDGVRWNAAGWANCGDKDLLDAAAEHLDEADVGYCWVEAEVTPPTIPTVQGKEVP